LHIANNVPRANVPIQQPSKGKAMKRILFIVCLVIVGCQDFTNTKPRDPNDPQPAPHRDF
jgi:hypothetical protein